MLKTIQSLTVNMQKTKYTNCSEQKYEFNFHNRPLGIDIHKNMHRKIEIKKPY